MRSIQFEKIPIPTNMLSIPFALLDACQEEKDPQEICKPILKYYIFFPSQMIVSTTMKESFAYENGT